MTEKNPILAILIIAFIGGLMAGVVCSAVMLFTANILIQDFSEQLQNVSINCSEEINPYGSKIILGDAIYYCTIEERGKGQDNEPIVSLAPGGDYNNKDLSFK